MWLHPATWPAAQPAQRRARVATRAVALGLTGWLIGHAAVGADPPLDAPGRDLIQIGSALLLLGLVLVTPRPRLGPATYARAARLLTPPVVLGIAVVVVANLDHAAALPTPVRAAVLTCWWVALGTCALTLCRLVCGPRERAHPALARLLQAHLRWGRPRAA